MNHRAVRWYSARMATGFACANANGANAISIFAPCHRVIGSNNMLTGYGGGLEAKQKLLALEGVLLW